MWRGGGQRGAAGGVAPVPDRQEAAWKSRPSGAVTTTVSASLPEQRSGSYHSLHR